MSTAMDRTPGSMLEVYMHAIAGKTNDDFLDQVNLGVGNYNEAEYWQQVGAFRRGLFADAGLARRVMERARLESKRAVVDAIYDNPDSSLLDRVSDYPDPDDLTRNEYFGEHADRIWESLGDDEYPAEKHQAWLVHRVTGIPSDWVPPHWRMLKMRHEASRSKGAHLIDNLFGRPPEPDDMRAMEDFQP